MATPYDDRTCEKCLEPKPCGWAAMGTDSHPGACLAYKD
jgi:hypothetical protein